MKRNIKLLQIVITISIICISCGKKRDIDKEIKQKITAFYKYAETKDYRPISYTQFDTLQNLRNPDGSILWITGRLSHTFYGRSNSGNINVYTNSFDITITKDNVIVMPDTTLLH